ncbi:unnamed protein product, partial [Effrenium voratum]
SFISTHLSLGRALGYPAYTFRRLLVLVSCLLGVVQRLWLILSSSGLYGLVLTNGVSVSDFNDVYGLTEKE